MAAGGVISARTPRTFAYPGAPDHACHADKLARSSDAENPLNPIESMDVWARHVWRHRRDSPWILIALPLWLAIRVTYRLTHAIATVAYYLSRPFVWTFWRLYEIFGPVARVAKRLYWTLLYPPIELAGRAVTWIFWRLYALCGPLARTLQKAFWTLIYPPIERTWAGMRWLYWRFAFPLLEPPARLLGFSLRGVRAAEVAEARRPRAVAHAEMLRAAFHGGLSERDALAWTAGALADFEPLFDCLPRFGLSRPTAAALFLLLTPDLVAAGPRQLRLLGLRLRSGSPCRRVWFYAPDTATAQALSEALGAKVRVLGGCTRDEFDELVRQRALDDPPALVVDKLGPVVLLVTALWGRVGSTLIFDAQTQLLIENGAVVVRVLVDHNPAHGSERASRRDSLLQENFTIATPHLSVVLERNDSSRARARLHRTEAYRRGSAVRRFELELDNAKALDEDLLAWAGATARFAVVNHAMHMAVAERISKAPIVLETHDVLTDQLDAHGWPKFISFRREPKEQREADQRALWRRAHVCVNLTPEDHAAISPHARAAAFVRPCAESAEAQLRPWPEVVEANALPKKFAEDENIDVLLWGDWHDGNVRAVKWFIEKVLPAEPALAHVRVALIGRVNHILPTSLRLGANVVTAGFVDRIEDFFGRARVLAIADQDASGVSVKAIETIRFARPFVSTKAGMRGLDLSGLDFTPCDTASSFAADLVALLGDRKRLRDRARVASEIYARNISHDVYERQWRELIASVDPDFARAPAPTAPPATTDGPAMRMQSLATPRQVRPVASAAAKSGHVRRSSHVLAAVICTYNRYDVLPGAVESLLKQDIATEDLEILVVDNSPDQEAAARFGAQYNGTRVRYLLEPVAGLSNARNVGAENSAAKYVAYIDDDAVAAPDWARKLIAGFQAFGKAGVAGGRIVPRWITPRPDWLPDELIGNLSIVDWGGSTRPLGKTEWIAGCNIAFDRSALLELGGFSRSLGRVGAGVALLSNEESAVIEKFADVGRRAIYVPDATVEHLIEPARLSQQWFRRRAAWQAVSDYIKDPQKAARYAGAAAERLRREINSENAILPPGYVRPLSERERFRHDVGLMYDVVIAMLAGGVEIPEDGTSATLQERLLASVRQEMQRNPQLRSTLRKLANL